MLQIVALTCLLVTAAYLPQGVIGQTPDPAAAGASPAAPAAPGAPGQAPPGAAPADAGCVACSDDGTAKACKVDAAAPCVSALGDDAVFGAALKTATPPVDALAAKIDPTKGSECVIITMAGADKKEKKYSGCLEKAACAAVAYKPAAADSAVQTLTCAPCAADACRLGVAAGGAAAPTAAAGSTAGGTTAAAGGATEELETVTELAKNTTGNHTSKSLGSKHPAGALGDVLVYQLVAVAIAKLLFL